MEDRKAVKLALLLTKKEKKECVNWLGFEHGPDSECEKLFHIIWQDYVAPKGKKGPRDFKEVWETIYPNKPYNDGSFRKLCSKLATSIENLLAYKSLKNHEYEYPFRLVNELKSRNGNHLAESILRKIEKKLIDETLRDTIYYYYNYKLSEEKIQSENQLHKHVSKQALEASNLLLDLWFLHARISKEHILKDYNYRYQDLQPSIFSESIHKVLAGIKLSDFPVLAFYVKLYDQLDTSPEKMQSLIEDLWQLKDKIHQKEYNNFYLIVCNYFVRKANAEGKESYLKIILSLYEWALEEGIFSMEKVMAIQYYRSMFKIALRLNLKEKYNDYLNKLKDVFGDKMKDDYQLLVGLKMFYEKKFSEAAKTLGTITIQSPRAELDRRNLRLQSLFELGEKTELETEIHSLKEYVRTQKDLSKEFQNSWYNRIKLFERLIRIQNKGSLENLLKDIQTTEPLGNRDWLLTKTKEALQKSG